MIHLYEFYNKPQDLISWNKNDPENTGKVEFQNAEGQYHRIEGPAIERPDGYKAWYLNGKRHRVDGPAIEWSSCGKEWWLNGKTHRVDGPAIEDVDGTKYWYLNDIEYSEDEWKFKLGR